MTHSVRTAPVGIVAHCMTTSDCNEEQTQWPDNDRLVNIPRYASTLSSEQRHCEWFFSAPPSPPRPCPAHTQLFQEAKEYCVTLLPVCMYVHRSPSCLHSLFLNCTFFATGDHSTGVWVGGSDNGHAGQWAWFPTGINKSCRKYGRKVN